MMLRNPVLFALMFVVLPGIDAAEPYLSPCAVVSGKDGKQLYIAEGTARGIAVFDITSKKVAKTIALPVNPAGLALSPDGKTLYATGGGAQGKVFCVDTQSGKIVKAIPLGHTPTAPVVSPDGKTLYVCNRFNNCVSVIDPAAGKEIAKVAVVREPVAAALTPDGKLLFVANQLPTGAADGEYIAAVVSVIDTAAKKAVTSIPLPNGSTGLRGICVSPDGKHVYVTHILARYHMPTTQLERGWMNTNALSVIDAARKERINTVLLDSVDLGAANPWAVACTADGKLICATLAGTHELCVVDRQALHKKLSDVAAGKKVSVVSQSEEDVPNDLSFLVGMKRRLKLAGKGPRAAALMGTKAYVAEYFTDTLGVVDVNPDGRHRAASVAVGPKMAMTPVRKGEMFFHDADLCFQNWQSCSSCHPDARTDGLNWDLLNDGMGNPKQTKSMLLAHRTPPAMMGAVRENAEAAVRAGIRFIQFSVRPEEDAVAIDEYLKSLKPVPSPHLVDGRLSDGAKRGEALFVSTGCASCHVPPLFTDLQTHDVGTGRNMDKDRKFDTPTIIENWRTAPYLYDGRAATMMDVIKRCNPADAHGKTSALTPDQLSDLAAYILSQ